VSKLVVAWTGSVFLVIGATSAQADWQGIVWRPAIDAIGNAEAPAAEGVARLPDGVDFGPDLPARRGRVTVDNSPTTLPPTVHLRSRKVLAIGR
jgi:hypothetical protein